MDLEFYSINRTALTLRPTPALVEWINRIFPNDPITYEDTLGHDDLDIFLIPNFDDIEEAKAWLQENFEPFLRYALNDWCTDETEWPKPLDWDLFERFLEYSLQTVVVDTMDEEYDEEFDDFDEETFFEDFNEN